MTKSTSIIPKPSRQILLTPSERLFSQTFIRDFRSPHARQRQGEGWKTYYQNIHDGLVKNHLEQNQWLATKACWYPQAYNLDLDSPTPAVVEKIEATFEKYGIRDSQLLYLTSPSYAKKGNFRVYFRLEYAAKIPTFELGTSVLHRVFSDVEIYPQKRRKDRLPFGRDSHIIEDNVVLSQHTWEAQLHYFHKLDAIDIDVFPRQQTLINPSQPAAAPVTPTGDAANLLKNGLQQKSTRYQSQYQILNFLWRNNWMPRDAANEVKKWIRTRNNGFSTAVNSGDWKTIHAEIDRQVASIWARTALSDAPNNLTSKITKADLLEAGNLFPNDVVNQKRFIALVSYYRPRAHHDFVFIPYHAWHEIAGEKTYQSFISELEQRKILEANRQYKIGLFCRRFRLQLPIGDNKPIMQDQRNTTDYYTSLKATFNTKREVAEAMKLNRMTIHRHF